MGEQGSMIVNGKKVDGRTLSFGDEGVKTSLGHPAPIGSTTSLSFDTGVSIYFTKRNNLFV